MAFLPTTLNFSALSQGSTSPVRTVTVTNSGSVPALITAIILGGSNPADFSAPTSTCIGAPLLPNASCIVNETFTPSTALSATVSAGQPASYALQLTPGLDYNGMISFTCTGAPLGATCQAPASMVLNIGAPATFTVTVLTSGSAMLAPKVTSRRSRH